MPLHAAGVDGGAAAPWAAGPACDDPQPVRRFGAHTAARDRVADWVWAGGLPTVALASTGVAWIPLFEVLEARGVQRLLVDPGTMPRNGRPQSDGQEGQGLPRLHPSGVLSAWCRPAEQVVVVRSAWRQRAALLAEAARALPPLQQALTQRPVKRQPVVRAMTGVTGVAMRQAILAGARAPQPWAPWRDPRGKQDAAAIAQALDGPWRAEPLWAFQQALERSACPPRPRAAGAARVAAHLPTCAARRQGEPWPPTRGQRRHRHRPACDPRGPLHRLTGVDVPQSAGVDAPTALLVISAMGLERSRGPSEPHGTSWLGVCPPQKVSGGTGRSSRTRLTTHRAAAALRLAAARPHHAPRALGAEVRRMQSRLGPPKAITATAHRLARRMDRRLKHGTAYVAQGLEADEQQYRDRVVPHLTRRAKALGYDRLRTPEDALA